MEVKYLIIKQVAGRMTVICKIAVILINDRFKYFIILLYNYYISRL